MADVQQLADKRSLEERKMDAFKSILALPQGSKIGEAVEKFSHDVMLFAMLMPMVMGRETWEKVWPWLRDTVEKESEKMLAVKEQTPGGR